MSHILKKLNALLREEDGLTTVEYAIAGSLVGLLVVAAFTNLGREVGTKIGAICAAVKGSAC